MARGRPQSDDEAAALIVKIGRVAAVRLTRELIESEASQRAGVVTTSQLRALGADRKWLARQVSSGRWQRLHRGVLLTHSGPAPWHSLAWGALVYAGRSAALSHDAAAFLHGMVARPPELIDVTIPEWRRVSPSEGIALHRRVNVPARTGWPDRTALVDTALDLVAAASGTDSALSWLCDAVRAGVSPRQLLREVLRRPKMRNRALAVELLAEVAAGVESPLEGRYHRDVERAHGLPTAELQVREVLDGMWIRADRKYRGFDVRVELDGALAHPRGRTDRDTWRDNAVLIAASDLTLRYRWRHVHVEPCRTAAQVLSALRLKEPGLPAHRCKSPSCSVT